MRVFEANISPQVATYLQNILQCMSCTSEANQVLHDNFGIVDFFENDHEIVDIKVQIAQATHGTDMPDRAEYGDFQTNKDLADNVLKLLLTKNLSPDVIVEPTCGKGSFVVASLRYFRQIKQVIGVEIYKPYVWECKFNIMDFYLNNPQNEKPAISIIHSSVFDFNFGAIAQKCADAQVLILGNPPWVTNAKLGSINATNLPKKGNFKHQTGLDAITGKGNFDIAESITLMLIEAFRACKGSMAMLVKNTVIKNIVFEQIRNKYPIGSLEKYGIDSRKEFNVSVEAALFFANLDAEASLKCTDFDFYDSNTQTSLKRFGWVGHKFVSDVENYALAQTIDGICPFEWRQGIKHDCSSVMELDKVNGHYVNGLNEEITLENNLVYGMLKSSDLKQVVMNEPRKYTIVTQKKVGQETSYIKQDFPKTYQYLSNHQTMFGMRKSSIYKNKPLFSIFGVGDYSFKPYKVAISGLYKTFHFTLVLLQQAKPIMLDDTCYMLGFENIAFAAYTLILLNTETTVRFLKSITFADAKRTFTKDVLMRINLLKLAELTDKKAIVAAVEGLNQENNLALSLDQWDDYLNEIKPAINNQIALFV